MDIKVTCLYKYNATRLCDAGGGLSAAVFGRGHALRPQALQQSGDHDAALNGPGIHSYFCFTFKNALLLDPQLHLSFLASVESTSRILYGPGGYPRCRTLSQTP
jgi:hypothetical protein